MDVFDFLNQNKPLVRKTISGGTTNGRVMTEQPKTLNPLNRRDDYKDTVEYASEYVTENERQMVEVSLI